VSTVIEERYIGEILVRQGALSPDRLEQALDIVREKGVRLRDVLSSTQALDDGSFIEAVARELGIPVITRIQTDQVPAELVAKVPINFARQHRLLPLGEQDGAVRVAMSNLLDLSPLDDLRSLLGKRCEAVAAPADLVEDAINRVYERRDENALAEADAEEDVEELQDLIDMTDEAPVIRWVNNLFYEAVRDRASDIHIEPSDNDVVVRYRIDGDLYNVKSAHKAFLPSIIARVKIEASLNIAEKRLPQDGRITKKIKGKLVDVRVSTIPTAKGERVVLRLLDKEQILLDLPDLGFSHERLSIMEHLISRPNGIILVTGPTGAGKTTTLYACLNKINKPDVNILTVEDPVEYELRGISQMHVQPKIGLTFASGLRAFLRQDPDVIMVGEIRDFETAEIAIHASLTGHLVFSTLHTNDAASAVTRLIEMGVQPFLISTSLLGVLAQRLVRKLCLKCRKPYIPTDEDLRSLDIDPDTFGPPRPGVLGGPNADPSAPIELSDGDLEAVGGDDEPTYVGEKPRKEPRPVFYKQVGCQACAETGYSGRTGIYELLVIDDAVRREISANSDGKKILNVAVSRGMISLRVDGVRQVMAGRTSMDEVLAATHDSEVELE
jgi:general secretion pathway protein E